MSEFDRQTRKQEGAVAGANKDFSKTRPRDEIEWDQEVPNLGVRLRGESVEGRWIVQWRVDGKTRRRSLGTTSTLNANTARALAREAIRSPTFRAPRAKLPPTIEAFVPRFLADCSHRWKPVTFERVRRMCRLHVVPSLGEVRINELSRPKVLIWFDELNSSHNWALSVLSSIMLHAELLGLRKINTNPCAGLRRKQSGFVARYPGRDAYRRLGEAISRLPDEDQSAAKMIRFLALTGARRGEALNAEWEHVHGDRLTLPDSKTGPKTIWLPPTVQSLLQAIREQEAEASGRWIFGITPRKTFDREVSKVWLSVRRFAGCTHLRMHDLRHGYASVAARQGHDLKTIGRLLGHADFATTLGYAHLSQRHVSEAAQRVSQRLGSALKGNLQPPIRKSNSSGIRDQTAAQSETFLPLTVTSHDRNCSEKVGEATEHDDSSNNKEQEQKMLVRDDKGPSSAQRRRPKLSAKKPPSPGQSMARVQALMRAVEDFQNQRYSEQTPRQFCAQNDLSLDDFERAREAYRQIETTTKNNSAEGLS